MRAIEDAYMHALPTEGIGPPVYRVKKIHTRHFDARREERVEIVTVETAFYFLRVTGRHQIDKVANHHVDPEFLGSSRLQQFSFQFDRFASLGVFEYFGRKNHHPASAGFPELRAFGQRTSLPVELTQLPNFARKIVVCFSAAADLGIPDRDLLQPGSVGVQESLY
ncbi:MAG TPA: hypothetical protein VKR31_13800 [Rhizomicrobium sp.]|nr:hypothetical protein [Rhizomicrobium sp.]